MKTSRNKWLILSLLALNSFAFNSCSSTDGSDPSCELIPLNIFTLNQEKDLGLQVATEIEANSQQYPILSEQTYPEAYTLIRRIRDRILASGTVRYKDDFVWQVKIINDSQTLNAFCTPGGYIYVYTGLMKFLQTEDDLAGVMGHEIAHADRRHSTKSMTTQYGLDAVLSIVSGGNPGLVETIATQLGQLRYSRCHESEADAYSVDYLAGTSYRCNGAATFFQKLLAQGSGSTPQFLSTHPNPDNRVEAINNRAQSKGCNTTNSGGNAADYQRIVNALP